MTDLEKTKVFLAELGIKYEEETTRKGLLSLSVNDEQGLNEDKWDGYSGFGFFFNFNRDGKLDSFGAWE